MAIQLLMQKVRKIDSDSYYDIIDDSDGNAIAHAEQRNIVATSLLILCAYILMTINGKVKKDKK